MPHLSPVFPFGFFDTGELVRREHFGQVLVQWFDPDIYRDSAQTAYLYGSAETETAWAVLEERPETCEFVVRLGKWILLAGGDWHDGKTRWEKVIPYAHRRVTQMGRVETNLREKFEEAQGIFWGVVRQLGRESE